MKDELILKNNFIIELESGASLADMKALFADKNAMVEAWGELTEDNLSDAVVKNSDGIVISRMESLVLASETSTVQADGSVLTSFNLREKTDIEKRLGQVEAGLEVHDGAIMDTAEALSAIVEAKEGGGGRWQGFMA